MTTTVYSIEHNVQHHAYVYLCAVEYSTTIEIDIFSCEDTTTKDTDSV